MTRGNGGGGPGSFVDGPTLAEGSPGIPPPPPYPMGLMGLLATVGMLFAAFASALLVRRGATDWHPVVLPGVLWLNTVVLLLSSGTLERARARVRGRDPEGARRWLAGAGALGILFLTGQLAAWRQLIAAGILLPSNPHAAFFYVLSAAHAAHLLGGLGALGWGLRRLRTGGYTPQHHDGLTHIAVYWHFVGGVWVFLLGLLLLF